MISTVAPAASRVFLIDSASSFLTPSLIAFGAPSTKSLASFKPRPVIVLTSLRTAIFLSAGTEAKITLTSASASASAAGAAAVGYVVSKAVKNTTPDYDDDYDDFDDAEKLISFIRNGKNN